MESLARDLETMVRTPLAASHVEAMRRAGSVVEVPAGEFVLTHGERMTHFMYVLEGEVEALDATGTPYGGGATLGPTQFIGEMNFLNDGNAMLSQRTVQDTTFVSVERRAMLELMSQIPEMSDIIVTVFAARRRRMLETGLASLTLIGADTDRGVSAVAAFASRNKIPFRSLDLGGAEAEEIAQTCALARRGPAVIYGPDTVVEDATPRGVAKLLGIDIELGGDEVLDVLIVGGGPAGIAAAVYAGSEGLSALVLEDLTIGGQAGTSSRIENYMGFPTGISGADLCWRGEVQAMKFGTRFAMPRRATRLEVLEDGTFCVRLGDGEQVCARSVVIATGVQYRKLGLEQIEDFERAGRREVDVRDVAARGVLGRGRARGLDQARGVERGRGVGGDLEGLGARPAAGVSATAAG